MPKTYKVNGPHAVFDTEPGDTFTADLPDEQHRLLTAYGHITEVEEKSEPESYGITIGNTADVKIVGNTVATRTKRDAD